MTKAKAVVFTLYQRPFYTRQILDAWSKVRGIKDWYFHFFIDPSNQSMAQLEIAHEFLRANELTGAVEVNEVKQGVLTAPWLALGSAFSAGYEHVVLAEEDVEVSDDILEYMDYALGLCDIACAWSDQEGPEDEIECRYWFCPWGWGLTDKVWFKYLRDTWDHDYSTADERGPGGWDCNIGLRLVHELPIQISFPRSSRSRHIGRHLGTHQNPALHGVVDEPLSFKAHRDPVEEWFW